MFKWACVYGKQDRLTCKASILKIQEHDRIACIRWVLADWPPDPQPLPRAISPPRSQRNVPLLIGREPPPGSLVGGWWTHGKALRRVGGGLWWAELDHVPVTERHLVTHRGHLQPQDELPLLIVEGNAIPAVIWSEKIKWAVGQEEKNEGCVGRSYDAAYR